jgi:hypothetical protein
MQSGLAASFITPSPKKTHGDGDQFDDDKPSLTRGSHQARRLKEVF